MKKTDASISKTTAPTHRRHRMIPLNATMSSLNMEEAFLSHDISISYRNDITWNNSFLMIVDSSFFNTEHNGVECIIKRRFKNYFDRMIVDYAVVKVIYPKLML